MNKKVTSIIVIIIVLILAIWLVNREPKTDTENVNNVSMLQTGGGLQTMHKDNVEYFPGAKGYLVRPMAEEQYPGIVLIHENRGLRDEIKMMADLLASQGYVVLAVDLLGAPVETQEEARALTAKFDQKKGIANMKAAVAYLRTEEDVTKVGTLGWCFGGGQSLLLALSGEKLDATGIYYGKLATTTTALKPIKWPVLGVFGDADQIISTTSVQQFTDALALNKIENEIYLYPGVGHAFANPSGPNYAPAETKDAWAKTVAFFNKHLK